MTAGRGALGLALLAAVGSASVAGCRPARLSERLPARMTFVVAHLDWQSDDATQAYGDVLLVGEGTWGDARVRVHALMAEPVGALATDDAGSVRSRSTTS